MVKKRTIRSKSAASTASAPQPPTAPSQERKRSKSTGAIGRLVQQVQKTALVKARRDGAAIERVEEGIRQRFIEDADVFDKDNLIAELITENRGNFKRMDVELTAQHTVSTNNLHRLVFHHSNNFLNLFRDVHRAHDFVDDLKRDVQSIKSTIAALSRVSFSKQEVAKESSDAYAGPVMGMRSTGTARRTHRASMIVDVQSAEMMESGSFHPTHMLQCASFRLASQVMQPSASAQHAPTPSVSSGETAKQLETFRDVALEEVRQRIGELQLTSAAEWIAALESEAFEKGLGPVVLQLEHELAAAAEAQLFRLPMSAAYFDALHLPLLRLLVQLGRAQTATGVYLKLHSNWIAVELRLLKERTEPRDFCLVATDYLVSLIKVTLQNMLKLGIVTKRSSKRRVALSPAKHSKSVPATTSAAQGEVAIPVVNAQVILWVRREIESFGSSVLAKHILTVYRSSGINVADGATHIGLVADIVATCVDSIRSIEGLGIPHADVHFMASITEPVTQLLRDLSMYTAKTQSTTSQSLWNAVKLSVRAQAKTPPIEPNEGKRLVESVLAETTALNRRLVQRFDGMACSSHTQLITMLCSPVSAQVFQSPMNQKISNETLHDALKLGLKNDPFVWSKSRAVRRSIAEAYSAQPGCAREIVQSLASDINTAIPRPFRLAVVEALGTHRFNTLAIRKVQDRDTDERFAFLTAHAGAGLTASTLTPSALNQLLSRADIATPYWSRAVRDIFSDALANRSGQMKGSLNNLLQLLSSHAGTNPITLTHRKIVVNVLRNRRFQSADIPEDMVERMDPTHLEWLFSPSCPTAHWNTSGPREYIADVLDAHPQLGRAEWIKVLRNEQLVDDATRNAIQTELRPIVDAVSVAEDGLRSMDVRVPSLDDVKQLLTPASAIAGQWPRRIRIIFACALEKKCSGHYFSKIGDVARKLRDHTQLRLSVDDRKLVVSQLSSKADDFITGALALCGDTTADEQEELCATALISPDHLTFLIARSDIGVPCWSRATRDALADMLERLQQKTSGSAQQSLIDLLRSTPISVRITVEQRKHIRDALKRKVETDCSAATREIARQQWMRVTPSVLQRMVLSTASQSQQGQAAASATAGDVWCDIIRFVVSTSLRRIIEHWEATIEVLRGPTRVGINKNLRVEISGLLAGYAFTAADIAKRSSTVDGKPDASARPQLASKSIVAHDDFTYTLSSAVGPSQLFHTTASVILSLMAAAGCRTVTGNRTSVSALLQDAVMAESVDVTLASVASAMVGCIEREVAAVVRLCKNKIVLQGWQAQAGMDASRENNSWKAIFRYGLRNSACDWIFQTVFALYVDALALATLTAFAQTRHGVAQLMGENVPARSNALRQFQNSRMAPLLSDLCNRLILAAYAGPMAPSPTDSDGDPCSKVIDELLLVKYFGSHTLISDVTIPVRMAGSVLPIEGYTAWKVATTVPGYPRFSFTDVRLDDEAFLFHYAVQLSLNAMSMFQGMLLGDYDDQSASALGISKEPLIRPSAFLSNLLPNDTSLMQHWVVLKGYGSNYVAATALLQHLVLSMTRRLCDVDGVLCSSYQRNGGINQETANPQVIRQILIFFAVLYYFWAPLYTSAYQSSLLAQGLLSGATDIVTPVAPKKGGGAAPAKQQDPHCTTSEVSLANIDGQQAAKKTLSLLSCPEQSPQPTSEVPDDILANAIVKFFADTPALQKYSSALFSDAMKQKLAKLFTKVNLLEFVAKQTLGNGDAEDSFSEDDEEESDYSEPATPASSSIATAVITFAHLHELLVHYTRPMS